MRAPLFILLLSSICGAQSIIVRAINGNSGDALANREVAVQFFFDKPSRVTPPLRLKTDSEGEARFVLPNPSPDHMEVRLSPPSPYWNCACLVMADTSKVLREGIVSVSGKHRPHRKIDGKPAEIIFAATPFSTIQRLLYPLNKE